MRDPRVTLAGSVLVLALAMLVATAIGSEAISLRYLFDTSEPRFHAALVDARLPRVVLGALAGGGLAVAGVAFQATLRNPLAEPYVLGVSGGCALGATLAIVLGVAPLTYLGASLVPLAALAGGAASTAIVYALVRRWGTSDSHAIILSGVVLNAIASALITFIKTLVSASKAQELLFWLMGFLDVQAWPTLAFVALYIFIGIAVLMRNAGQLNLLALGNDGAAHLGVNVKKLERHTFLAGSLIVGAIVSVTGLIGFVGLLVPHAMRKLVGPDVRLLLPTSFFFGGATLVICDAASRLMFRWLHTEPPVGAVTALIGGPLFLVLMVKRPNRV